MGIKKLEWEEKYSVGVEEIDDQRKWMFGIINELLDLINTNSPEQHLKNVIDSLTKYKIFNFAIEEKYFKEFNYEGAEEHIKKHREFNEKLMALKEKNPKYTIEFAFELIDFLEDWLINHLLSADQEYKECFRSHGLK